jgi:hypothetical protein
MTVERWAGNGGQMAGSKQKKQEVESKPREQTAENLATCSGCDLGCSQCLNGGARTLRQLACQTVQDNGAGITESLLKRTLGGDFSSTKLLISLAEPRAEKEGAKKRNRRGRNAAQELAEEPQWRDEETETTMETGFAGREPEG